jgi:CspA family cold shock protein
MGRVYVKRDESGEILQLGREPEPGMTETLPADDPAVQQFLDRARGAEPAAVAEALQRSDAELVRVVEDLTNLLIEKGVIRFTELPTAAQRKLLDRRQLRSDRKALDLIAGSDDNGDDLFAHFSEIKAEGFKSLQDGQKVSFDVTQGKKGLQASNIRPA